jgi:hypothetical protein
MRCPFIGGRRVKEDWFLRSDSLWGHAGRGAGGWQGAIHFDGGPRCDWRWGEAGPERFAGEEVQGVFDGGLVIALANHLEVAVEGSGQVVAERRFVPGDGAAVEEVEDGEQEDGLVRPQCLQEYWLCWAPSSQRPVNCGYLQAGGRGDKARQGGMAWFNALMMSDVGMKMAARELAEEMASRVREFEGFVPSGSDPNLASVFLEAQVRSLVEERLRPKRLVSGIFSVPGASVPTGVPRFIEGAVYDPGRGRPMLERGGFWVLNPSSCVGCILIKPSLSNIAKFENRLRGVAMGYFRGGPPGMVMAIVASDATPVKKSDICTRGRRFPAHQFTHPKWCPIFILFARERGVFKPHFPAIEAMVANLERVVEMGNAQTLKC